MSVHFRLPSERASGLVGFAWSPLLEAALSTRPVVHPKRYPMHLPWSRRCRELPAELQAELRALTNGWPTMLPGVFEIGLTGDMPAFEDELASLARLDARRYLFEMSLGYGGLNCVELGGGDAVLDDEEYAPTVLSVATQHGEAHEAAVRQLFDDPAGHRDRLVDMLDAYWRHAFRDEWERIRPRIEAELTDGARTLVTAGVPAMVEELLPEGHWDAETSSIVVDRNWERHCDVLARGGMLMVPTVYGWPRVLIELAEPWAVSIIFPLRDMRQPEVPQASDHEVADGLRALGDETRLQITRLVAEQPRSTKELAALLSLSESAVSRHLKILAGAGVVDSHRDGYFVLYRLVPDRIGALGGALRRTLGLAQAVTGRVPALPVSVARSTQSD